MENATQIPKKRSFPDSNLPNIQDSNYFKIRALIKDLRPHFLEILRTPDFRASKAASEINQQMKVLMKLYEDMTSETNTMEKCKNTIAVDDQKKSTEVKPAEPAVEKEKVPTRKPSEERPTTVEEVASTHGSYIVGGSAFGWNFITYASTKLTAYYGRSKEDFRAANPIPACSENVE